MSARQKHHPGSSDCGQAGRPASVHHPGVAPRRSVAGRSQSLSCGRPGRAGFRRYVTLKMKSNAPGPVRHLGLVHPRRHFDGLWPRRLRDGGVIAMAAVPPTQFNHRSGCLLIRPQYRPTSSPSWCSGACATISPCVFCHETMRDWEAKLIRAGRRLAGSAAGADGDTGQGRGAAGGQTLQHYCPLCFRYWWDRSG